MSYPYDDHTRPGMFERVDLVAALLVVGSALVLALELIGAYTVIEWLR